MTDTYRGVAALVAVCCLLLGTAGIGAAAQTALVQDAQLAIDQPHYIDQGVTTESANGTTVHVARGSHLELTPQNFAPADVTSFGVSGNASLSYDGQTGQYQLDTDATGTYELFWTVERPTVNATDNRTEQVRYTARIRVTGGVDLIHRRDGAVAETEAAAANWREFNSTLQERGLIGAAGLEPTLEEMVRWYELRKNPTKALTGGITAYIILGLTAVGPLLLWLMFFGGWQWIVTQLRRRLHILEAVEAEEGAAKTALSELERKEKLREPQNWDWQDIDGFDDHLARAFREVFGPTVHDGAVEYLNLSLPRQLIADRLQAMGQDGWLAVDTGAGVEFVHRDEVRDVETLREERDGEVIDLRAADRESIKDVRDAMDSWDHPTLRAFDLPDADYDATNLDTQYASSDLESIVERTQADMRHFDDRQAYGEYLQEFLESVEASPLTDDEGRPDEIRYAMSHFLKLAQLLDDRFSWPVVPWHREAIERALVDFDPEQEAQDVIDRAQLAGGGD